MKRRCVPLRADHNLLTPDTHIQSGVRLHPVIQGQLEEVAYLPAQRNDCLSSQSAVSTSQKQCAPVVSLTRRLRFEDETETEAESRYLERQCQRRRTGQRGTGALVSKPDLNLYVGRQGAGSVVDRQQRRWTSEGLEGECDSCRTVLGGGINLNLHQHTPVPEEQLRSQYRPRLNLRTEPIRETYIGFVTSGERGGRGRVANNQVKKMTNEVELNGNQMAFPKATPTTDLPINPYSPHQLTTSTQPSAPDRPSVTSPPSFSSPPVTSVTVLQNVRLTCTKAQQNLNQENQSTPAAAKPHRAIQSKQEVSMKSSAPSSTGSGLGKSQAPPTTGRSNDGQLRRPMSAELESPDSSLSEQCMTRDEPSRLSLRRLFATVKLSRTRSSSLDRHSSKSCPSTPDTTHPEPSGSRKSSSLLRKTPSVQSLNVGAPFLPLRKSSSVQSLRLEQKKKDRSADYRPASDQTVQRCLSIEDVGRPSSVRSVGRVLQVCSDGTFLLEISRPKNRTYGFIISRGRGRADSGVYVEDMADCSTQKLYAGLLAVGDEIVEVNGEKVVCLSLDQVTRLLTETTTATIRVLRHRRTPPR